MSWLLVFAMVIGFAPINLQASESTQAKALTSESDFTFDASTGTIKKYKGTDTDVVIPSTIGGVAVKEIGKQALGGKKLTSVTIPEGVETIGQGAFVGNLITELELPTTVKRIERLAFGNNKNLKELKLKEGLEYIGQQAFFSNTSLTGEVEIPSTVKTVMTTSFDKSGVTGLLIKGDKDSAPVLLKSQLNGETIEYVKAENPFKSIRINFNSLGTAEGDKYLDLGEVEVKANSKEELETWLNENINTTIIATYVNNKDSSGENDKEIDLEKIWNLDNFEKSKEFEVTASVDKEKYSELEEISGYGKPCVTCSATNLMIKLKVKLVESEDTEVPTEPEEPEVPVDPEDPSTKEWTQGDFNYDGTTITGFSTAGEKKLETLKDVNLPEISPDGKTITAIGDRAFTSKGIKSVTIPETVKSIGNVAFQMNELTEIKLPSKLESAGAAAFASNKIAEVTIPGTLKEIPNGMFSTNLSTKIVIEDGVETIGQAAFIACKIESLELPASIKSVGPTSFSGGRKAQDGPLKELILHEGLEKIDNAAFQYNNLKEVKIPSSLKEIGNTAFKGNGQVVELKTTNEAHLEFDNDKSLKNQKFVLIEEPSITEWTQEDFTYGQFQYKGRLQEEVMKFGITGFSEKGLEKIKENPDLIIPKEITKDGETTPIEGVSAGAFKGIKMNSVSFPKVDKGVEFVIKDSAFENSGLNKVHFEEGLKSIETFVFKNNNLTEVSIPSTVWKIGSEAFRDNQISELNISDDVDGIQIDNYSFSNNKLSLVKLPYSIFKIQNFVFLGNPGYENSGVVRLETRNPEHLKSTTYIVAKNEHHEIVLITEVNRSKLFKELQKVKEIVRDDYREKDLAEFDEVLNKAKEAFKNQESTQEQIDKALNDLIAAEAKLRSSSPDKSKLRDSIKRAEELNEGMFTPESYNAMKDALTQAKKVLSDLDKTAEEITEAQNKLDKAIEDLVINENALYTSEDFTYKGKAITGFSESGKEKFKVNKDLILPNTNPDGENIEIIGKGAFDLTKDPGVKLGTDTVSSANGMLSVKLPEKLKRIEEDAFRFNNFTNVEFPETLEFIGGTAFNGNRLEKVYLPDSVTEVEGGAFSLNQIKELRISPNMTRIENGTFGRNIKLTKLIIPEGIKSIGSSAFQGAPLTSLSISSTVEEIEGRAFTGHQLEELTIPGNVKKIGRQAFAHNVKWKRLKKLTLGEGIEEIGDSAFRFTLLKEVKLPNSMVKLADTAFKDAEDTNKTPVVVKLYTENKEHLKFNNEKSLKNQEVVFIGEEPTEPTEPSTPGVPTDPTEPSKPTDPTTPTEPTEPTEPTPGVPTTPSEDAKDDKEIKNTDTFKEVFEKINSTRISGKNRQLTAVEVSKRLYKQADTIVLTSSSEMIDSLTSSPLAIAANGPTLFVEKDTILQEVLAEINRLQPKKVIIAGGDSVVSEKVVKQIEAKGVEVERTAGENRYQTAVKIGEQIRRNSTNKTDIILANGNNFIDALTAGSLAAKMNIPILLTGDSSLNSITEKVIKEWGIKNVIVAGGDSQVSNGIISKLQSDGLKVERIAGKTRTETALKLAERVNPNPEKVIFANGRTYADALVASHLSKRENAPIVLIDKENVPVSVKEYLRENKIKDSIILGGDSSIANTK